MPKSLNYLIVAFCLLAFTAAAQVNYTANDRVQAYQYPFAYGANMGYYPPWQDEQLAEIAIGVPEKQLPGAGVNSLRPALFAHFLEYYGYDIRIPAFQYYDSLGFRNNVVFVGYPSEAQRDTIEYCPGHRSELFANLYTDIWDGGANGTPVNDENYYALYLYKMVSRYKDYVRFWEIQNEPDFDYSGKAWKPKTIPHNWWEANPDPCDYAIRAPVFHYIRMLRISWEVIKSLDPDAYVAIGGLGFPSFMDAVLRNTDNPDEGKVSAKYPLKGGAYFDGMSFHSYPHIDGSLREWSDKTGGFVYQRHSDAAVAGMLDRKQQFTDVLAAHGYDGKRFPEKIYLITECNIPRKAFGDFIGTEEAQSNFIIKALVACQQNDIEQFHIYNMAEIKPYAEATNEYDLMGLFQKLEGVPPYRQTINSVGISYRTTSQFLAGFTYDPVSTKVLNLPPEIGGGAFVNQKGQQRYILWAITRQDQSEAAESQYTFSRAAVSDGIYFHQWDQSEAGTIQFQTGNEVKLTGAPLFIRPAAPLDKNQELTLECSPNPFFDKLEINVFLPRKMEVVSLALWDHQGKLIQRFAENETWQKGTVQKRFTGNLPKGIYICRLETSDRTLIKRILRN